MDPEKGRDDADPVPPPPERTRLFEVYQRRAAECRQVAAISIDDETRQEWLRLANQWGHLALHAQRSG